MISKICTQILFIFILFFGNSLPIFSAEVKSNCDNNYIAKDENLSEYFNDDLIIKSRFGDVELIYAQNSFTTSIYKNCKEVFKIKNQWFMETENLLQFPKMNKDNFDLMIIASGNGTSCPKTLRILKIGAKNIEITKEFGNCSDYVDIVENGENLHFMFSCLCGSSCYDNYYPYQCTYNVKKGLNCEGQEHCSRYTCNEKHHIFFDLTWKKMEGENNKNQFGTGTIKKVICEDEIR